MPLGIRNRCSSSTAMLERASVAVQGGVASLSNKQLFQPDRQLPNADASCVIDCVSNSGRCPDIAQLSDTFHADRIDKFVLLRNQDDVNVLNIGVHRNEIVGEIVVDVTRGPPVYLARFVKSR